MAGMETDRDCLPFSGGPHDGASIAADFFGGRLPGVVTLMARDGSWPRYVADIDAEGPYYRFAGFHAGTPEEAERELLRARADRAREAAAALRGEFGRLRSAARELKTDIAAGRLALRGASRRVQTNPALRRGRGDEGGRRACGNPPPSPE
jgi:hypothetical protein